MYIKIFVNNPWQENTIVLYDASREAVVIDCGCFSEAEERQVREFLEREQLTPVALLDTHLHIDHILGNHFMKSAYGLEAQASRDDQFLIDHAVEYAAMLGLRGITPPPAVGKFLKEGEVIRFGNSELEVIAVPGHSPGGLCYYSREDRLLIAGDVLFAGSVGRADLPGGNAALLISGIREKLLTLPEEVRVIAGHGPSTTIGEEKRYNPFLH